MSAWEKDLLDEEKDLDWSWIRWQRLRWDFVIALEKSARHEDDEPEACGKPDCCLPLTSLLPHLGATLLPDEAGQVRLRHDSEFSDLCTKPMRDGMTILSLIHQFRLFRERDILSGFMEVPKTIARTVHSAYFGYGEHTSGPHASENPSRFSHELAYAFACLAFPDSHLARVHTFGHRA